MSAAHDMTRRPMGGGADRNHKTISMHAPNPDRHAIASAVAEYLAQGGSIQELPSRHSAATQEAAHLTSYNAAQQIKQMRTAGRSWAVIARDMSCTHAEAKRMMREFD